MVDIAGISRGSLMVHGNLPKRGSRVAPAIVSVVVALAGAVSASAAEREPRQDEPAPPAATLSGPARIAIVSLARQRVSFYDAKGGVIRSPVSSGQTGIYDTPVGVYSVLQKEVDHTSNIYDDAKMPFMQRITWSGVALHAGQLPGHPASHGCVRLPLDFAERIFAMTRLGLRVVISRDDVAPASITHPLLFQPRPLAEGPAHVESAAYLETEPPLLPDVTSWPARLREQERLKAIAAGKAAEAKAAAERAEPLKAPLKQKTAEHKKILRPLKAAEFAKKAAEQQLARIEKVLASATKPKAITAAEAAKAKAQVALEKAEARLKTVSAEAQTIAAALAAAKAASDAVESAKTAAADAAKDAERKMLPVSVFVSLKTQRLYIRQGHSPVMDVPVSVRDPEVPIGTHVFTALDYDAEGAKSRWNVVSVARYDDLIEEPRSYGRKRVQDDGTKPRPTDAAAAAAALDRITIPPELKERLSEYVWPGSSLIISDEATHKKETNKFTDFIVLVSGYPQGGIKKRRPPPDPYYSDPYGSFYYSEAPSRRSRYRYNPSPWSWW